MEPGQEANYIMIGGRLAGCVVASRLKQRKPSLDVPVLEAGSDPSNNPNIATFSGIAHLLGSELDWAYISIPQSKTGDRVHTTNAGKALGGGTVIKFGGWAQGDALNYDYWEQTVSD